MQNHVRRSRRFCLCVLAIFLVLVEQKCVFYGEFVFERNTEINIKITTLLKSAFQAGCLGLKIFQSQNHNGKRAPNELKKIVVSNLTQRKGLGKYF